MAFLAAWKHSLENLRSCENFVGTHKDSALTNPIPLGCIVGEEIKKVRMHIHKLIDPVWRSGKIKRKDLYNNISDLLGYEFHTANIENINEARKIYKIIKENIN